MQDRKKPKFGLAALVLGLGGLASTSASAQDVIAVANGVNMWDGQWHVEASPYGWLPWMYTSVQLPPIAGGGNPTIETQPSQYLKHVNLAAFLDATVRKGDWAIWTDLVVHELVGEPDSREADRPAWRPSHAGVRGSLRLSGDGRWYLPYEADVADGSKNWQNSEFLGVGYHFRWGDVSLAVRNLTYQFSDRPILEKVRMPGPVSATFRWYKGEA